MPTPAEIQQDPTPSHSQGFGAAENSDDTRQAQHTQANDTPTDVNLNACYARNYAETASRRADAFERATARHEMLAETLIGKMAGAAAGGAAGG